MHGTHVLHHNCQCTGWNFATCYMKQICKVKELERKFCKNFSQPLYCQNLQLHMFAEKKVLFFIQFHFFKKKNINLEHHAHVHVLKKNIIFVVTFLVKFIGLSIINSKSGYSSIWNKDLTLSRMQYITVRAKMEKYFNKWSLKSGSTKDKNQCFLKSFQMERPSKAKIKGFF